MVTNTFYLGPQLVYLINNLEFIMIKSKFVVWSCGSFPFQNQNLLFVLLVASRFNFEHDGCIFVYTHMKIWWNYENFEENMFISSKISSNDFVKLFQSNSHDRKRRLKICFYSKKHCYKNCFKEITWNDQCENCWKSPLKSWLQRHGRTSKRTIEHEIEGRREGSTWQALEFGESPL